MIVGEEAHGGSKPLSSSGQEGRGRHPPSHSKSGRWHMEAHSSTTTGAPHSFLQALVVISEQQLRKV